MKGTVPTEEFESMDNALVPISVFTIVLLVSVGLGGKVLADASQPISP